VPVPAYLQAGRETYLKERSEEQLG
jgi:hypothetical protein